MLADSKALPLRHMAAIGEFMKPKRIKFWLESPLHQQLRRPQRLGALAKWQRLNPEEAARIEARHASKLAGVKP